VPAVHAAVPAAHGAVPAPPPSSGADGGRRGLLVGVIAACVLAVVAAGIAVALVVGREDGADVATAVPVPPPAPTTPGTDPAAEEDPAEDDEARISRVGDPDGATDEQVESAVERTLKRHHVAIDEGDWSEAYGMLSRQKREQKRDEAARQGLPDGESRYRNQFQGELEGQLDTTATRVTLINVDPDAKEATVELAIPKRNGGCYSGTTWAVFEKGGWRYDLGSAGHADRPSGGTQVLQSRSSPC
jgi:hypothetical protein